MAETETTTEESTQEESSKDDQLGDAGQKALATERSARRAAEKAFKDSQKSIADLSAQIRAFEDRDKSEDQKTADRFADLEKQLNDERSARETAEKTTASMKRTQYGVDKGLPLALAKKLTGLSDEDLDAEIEELQPYIGQSEEKKKPPLHFRSGATDLGSASTDPKERAAEAVRQLQRQRD